MLLKGGALVYDGTGSTVLDKCGNTVSGECGSTMSQIPFVLLSLKW